MNPYIFNKMVSSGVVRSTELIEELCRIMLMKNQKNQHSKIEMPSISILLSTNKNIAKITKRMYKDGSFVAPLKR